MAGKEDTLYGDPANVWEEIQQKFPYYKTMEEYHGSNPAVDLSAVANTGEHQDDEDGAKEDTGDSGRAPTTPVTGPFTPRRKRAVDASSDIEATETPTCTIKKAKSTSSISKASASQQSSSTPAPQSRRRTIGDQIAAAVVASNESYEATIWIKTKAKAKT
ncbi:hypothetical protein AAF712_015888 [Marasmius tenuissimus]|uniref:Uncharacterized protein n=1 Tax=Marasmius tenuissimus TaxID=585030 RepID=A0ABR2Z727_9AGAR